MGYKSLRECVLDLGRHGHLAHVIEEVDPYLEMAEIQRRVYQAQGPALFFENVKDCSFPAVSNLFGTIERSRFLFRDTLERVAKIVQLKADPSRFFRSPLTFLSAPLTALHSLPMEVPGGAVLDRTTTIPELPQIQSWPDDGGPFVTLSQVYSENPDRPGIMGSNVGMYRLQLAGNRYQPGKELGLHYQIHRGLGVHHAAAVRRCGMRTGSRSGRPQRRPASPFTFTPSDRLLSSSGRRTRLPTADGSRRTSLRFRFR